MNYRNTIQGERLKFYEIAEDVYAAISPYRGLCWCNAGFINKGKGLAYDAFFDLHHAEEMRAQYERLSGRHEPAILVNSHYNCDHTWGNKVFKNSTIIMHEGVMEEHLTEHIPFWQNVVANGDKGSLGEQFLHNELKGFDLTGVEWLDPDVTIKDDITIRLDDMICEVRSVAPAHSASDLLMWLPREKVVFCGDLVFNGIVAYSAEGLRNWMKAFDYIIDLNPDVVVPGHGKLCGVEFVKEQKAYCANLFSEFEKHYDDEIGFVELAKKVNIDDYLHWLQPERIVLNIRTLWLERHNTSLKPDWEINAALLSEMRDYLHNKHGNNLPVWDPMSVWVDE